MAGETTATRLEGPDDVILIEQTEDREQDHGPSSAPINPAPVSVALPGNQHTFLLDIPDLLVRFHRP